MMTNTSFAHYRFIVIACTGNTSVDTFTQHFEQVRGLWNDFTNICLNTVNEMTIVGFTSVPRTDEDLENGTVLHHWSRNGFNI